MKAKLLIGMLFVCAVAFAGIAARQLVVKDAGGNTVFEVNDTGDLQADGDGHFDGEVDISDLSNIQGGSVDWNLSGGQTFTVGDDNNYTRFGTDGVVYTYTSATGLTIGNTQIDATGKVCSSISCKIPSCAFLSNGGAALSAYDGAFKHYNNSSATPYFTFRFDIPEVIGARPLISALTIGVSLTDSSDYLDVICVEESDIDSTTAVILYKTTTNYTDLGWTTATWSFTPISPTPGASVFAHILGACDVTSNHIIITTAYLTVTYIQ